ncbi:MAG: surface antigen msp4 family protein [Rickettsiaceae bacterium]|nr:surface antigen msp4 family protein [Rickettsiaceae bacterium]
MNKLLLTLSIAGLAIAPLAANAGDAGKVYVSVHGEGLITPENEVGFSGFGGVAVGYNITDYFRTEIEAVYRQNDADLIPWAQSGEVESLTGSLNVYYDLNNETAFTPYIGAGIGLTRADFKVKDIEALNVKDDVLSYQFMTGISYKLNENNNINLGYRYFVMDDVKFAAVPGFQDVTYGYETHAVEVGYRYSF